MKNQEELINELELYQANKIEKLDMQNFKVKAWIDDNETIRCCSQVCTDDCPRFNLCEDLVIKIEK